MVKIQSDRPVKKYENKIEKNIYMKLTGKSLSIKFLSS